MVAVLGTYQNGYVKLDREYPSDSPLKVILTFLEDVETSSKKTMAFSGSLSDAVVEERRADL
jgi:hypothetical protein